MCPSCSSAICSRTGAIILHGPHQTAQKSTTVGRSALSTMLSKVSSVTVIGFAMSQCLLDSLDRIRFGRRSVHAGKRKPGKDELQYSAHALLSQGVFYRSQAIL